MGRRELCLQPQRCSWRGSPPSVPGTSAGRSGPAGLSGRTREGRRGATLFLLWVRRGLRAGTLMLPVPHKSQGAAPCHQGQGAADTEPGAWCTGPRGGSVLKCMTPFPGRRDGTGPWQEGTWVGDPGLWLGRVGWRGQERAAPGPASRRQGLSGAFRGVGGTARWGG